MNEKEQPRESLSKGKIITRITLAVLYIILLVVILIFLIVNDIDPFISILIICILLLIGIGPLISGFRKGMYSQLFPKSKNLDQENENKRLDTQKNIKGEDLKPKSLDFDYRKPLIRKCNKCGMVLANFVKRCPNCNNAITD